MNEAWKENPKVNQAEKAVVGSINKLEHAMETLNEKVEGSRKKIQHVVDLGARQKDELLKLKSTAQESILPIYNRGVATGRRLYENVKANPRPYLYGAAALVGGLLLLSFARSRGVAAIKTTRYDENLENWVA